MEKEKEENICRRKRRKIFGEGKEGKYLQKEIFEEKTQGRRKRRNIFGEGKTEIEKEENVSRVKEKLRGGNEKKRKRKKRKIFGEGKGGKYFISGGEEKLRRKIFCQWERRKRRKIFGEG